jgi:large subunit ribosomal protein L10
MQKTDKEKVVADLVERLRTTESLIVADNRGLTNAELVGLRAKLRSSGAQLKVVKNTLTRRAAHEAGAEALLALLEGPTAIAFVESDGDAVAVAKALSDTAKETKVLSLRGGILSGRSITGADVEELAKLPAPEVVKSQLVGVIVAPLTQLAALVAAPLRDLVGLIDARIEQLGGASADAEAPLESEAAETTPVDEPAAEAPADGEPVAEAPGDEPVAEAAAEEPSAEAAGDEPAVEAGEAEAAETTDEPQQ